MLENVFPKQLLHRLEQLSPDEAAQEAAMHLSALAEELVVHERLIDAAYLDGLTACCNAFERALFFAEQGASSQEVGGSAAIRAFERELLGSFYREIATLAREAVWDGHNVRER
jgi:protein gp37